MSYMTANGTTTANAVLYAGADGIVAIKQDAILRDAERLVKRYGPPPIPVTAQYTSAASDAEMRVFDYLINTDGYVSSEGFPGVSTSFVDFEKVKSLVKSIVADYADAGSGSHVAYLEAWKV